MAMQDFLKRYTSSEWARFFMRDLHREVEPPVKTLTLSKDGLFPWMQDLKGKRVLFFCDLDGTLAPISPLPSQVRLPQETQKLLEKISRHTQLQFVVVSGRDQEFLQHQFVDHHLKFPLAACHGAYSYTPENDEWTNLIPHDSTRWKDSIMEILKLYTSRTPGSFIEDKACHYLALPEFAAGLCGFFGKQTVHRAGRNSYIFAGTGFKGEESHRGEVAPCLKRLLCSALAGETRVSAGCDHRSRR